MIKDRLHALRNRVSVRWIFETLRMRRLVRRSLPALCRVDTAGRAIGVVVTPWAGSAVPWFSITTGLLLAAQGQRVSFILDDLPFGSRGRAWRIQMAGIEAVASLLEPHFKVHRLQGMPDVVPQDRSQRAARLGRLAMLNAVWAQRGESGVQANDVKAAEAQLDDADLVIEQFLASHRFDVLFVPGGVWGTSGLWVEHAHRRSVRVSTYDSGGYGTLLLAGDGVACQLHDIPRAFAMLTELTQADAGQRALVHKTVFEEIARRRSGTDTFASQVQASRNPDARHRGCMLVALNSSWDSAALGLHTAFGSTADWLLGTVAHLLEHTSAPVVVRQHPVERLDIARSVDDYRSMLAEAFGDHPRLHFIAAADEVNSYALLEQSQAVVVYTSTIGVEAALHGKPVVTQASSYYASLGFVFAATKRGEYLDLLEKAARGELNVTQSMRDAALDCYYITQCCNWVRTPFTVPGLKEWVDLDLGQISALPNVSAVVQCIGENVPVSYLNHLARVQHVRHDAEVCI
jgi:hypothetical protein